MPSIKEKSCKVVTRTRKRLIPVKTKRRGKVLRKNPPSVVTEIYGNILAIEAQKGRNDLFAGKFFRHDFKGKGAKIYGLSDGSLWIKGSKRLWKNFKYPKSAKNWR